MNIVDCVGGFASWVGILKKVLASWRRCDHLADILCHEQSMYWLPSLEPKKAGYINNGLAPSSV